MSEPDDLSLDVAREALIQDQKSRSSNAGREINEVLAKYACSLVPTAIITQDGRISLSIELRPL